MKARIPAYAGVAASALLFFLCAPIQWPWIVLAWVALVPFLAGLDQARSLNQALGLGLLMSIGFVFSVLSWFADAMTDYTGASKAVGMVLLLVIAPFLQPQFVIFAAVRHLVRRRAAFWYATLTSALAYVASEWAFPKLFADTLGHLMFAFPWLRQAADIAGAHGLTFVLVVVNVCVWETLRRARERGFSLRALSPACVALLLVSGLAAYGAVRVRQFSLENAAHPGNTAPFRVGVVQADIAGYDRMRAEIGSYETVRTVLEAHYELSERAIAMSNGLDLLVWPETVYPTTFGTPRSEAGAAFDAEIARFVTRTGIPLVFGSYDVEAGNEFNASVFLEPQTSTPVSFQTYHKTMLFPLTERAPAFMESPLVRRRLPWLGTWQPGSGAKVVPIKLADGRTLRIAPLICFDAVDPGLVLGAVARGADVIVTLSNDSWFSRGGGPWQHLVVSAFRSIETRRPQIRATNTGISAIVSPTGELATTAGVHRVVALTATITPVPDARTLMLWWGNWFGPASFVFGGLLLARSLSK
jgi:apolipoprotein N-acyltransferase